MRILFTPNARREFLEIITFIQKDGRPMAAERFRKRVEEALRRLERFPASGRRIPEFSELPHREVIVPPYRFFYRLSGETIWIVAVWHGAQLPTVPRNEP